jgi:hypothetical protein
VVAGGDFSGTEQVLGKGEWKGRKGVGKIVGRERMKKERGSGRFVLGMRMHPCQPSLQLFEVRHTCKSESEVRKCMHI